MRYVRYLILDILDLIPYPTSGSGVSKNKGSSDSYSRLLGALGPLGVKFQEGLGDQFWLIFCQFGAYVWSIFGPMLVDVWLTCVVALLALAPVLLVVLVGGNLSRILGHLKANLMANLASKSTQNPSTNHINK